MVEAVYGAHVSTFEEASPVPQPIEITRSAGQTSAAGEPSQDTVTLSPGAQAHDLLHQGQTIAQIAASLGTSIETVNSYLGIIPITTTSSSAVSTSTLKAAASLPLLKAG